jgi:hypothetical protein
MYSNAAAAGLRCGVGHVGLGVPKWKNRDFCRIFAGFDKRQFLPSLMNPNPEEVSE